jgi:hypothetical protein
LCDGNKITTYFPVMTCEYCGETWFSYEECCRIEDINRNWK